MSNPAVYIEFTEAREGGLSKAKTDTASKFPVPDGSGYHTNKGVTWQTFTRLGPKLGYIPTAKLFYDMPDEVFDKIYHHYWSESKADLIDSQAIANLIFQALWGGGHEQLIKSLQKFFSGDLKVDGDLGQKTAAKVNELTAKSRIYEKMVYEYLHGERLRYLRSLDSYKANGKGWEARMNKLYEFNRELINKKP